MGIKELYDQIDREILDCWISESRQEDLHLDFKAVVSADDLSRDDRRNLAVAISGFANSDGGIIVWGVESRKDPVTRIDAASALKPMQNARAILSKLQSHTGTATNPTVDSILHRFVPNNSQDDLAGFIVTFVPPSDRGPHMAKLGEDRYYKRSGDSFYKMEHFDIEDMFGRRQKPQLSIQMHVLPVQEDDSQQELRFDIQNVGRALARYVGFVVQFENLGITLVSGDGMQDVSRLNQGRPVVSFVNNLGVIHPNGIASHAGSVRGRRVDSTRRILVSISYYCDGARSETRDIEVPPRQSSFENNGPMAAVE